MIVNMQIGKNGFNDNLKNDVLKHIKEKKAVKLKFLKNFLEDKDRKEVFKEIKSQLPEDLKTKLVGSVMFIER